MNMTTYERAKAYEYVFQKVKDFFEGKQKMYSDVKQTLEYLFPELAESDDEMIRKELIEYFEWNAQLLNNFDNKDVIAWLEKQGEQKSVDKVKPKFHEGDMIIHKELGGDYIHNSHKIIQVDMLDKEYRLEGGLVAHFSEQDDYELVEQKPVDKVEPKFKVGDWIICDGLNPTLITNIKNNTYDIEFIDGTKGFSNIDYIDSEFHLWTIDDAKDGDVLVTKEDNRPFIFKGLLDSNNPNCPVAYCGIDSVNLFLISPGNHWWSDKEVCPATKEQRDLLFQKMKEAGYEWDAEKKELKKIEQNPADKIESKFKVGDWITNGIDFTFKVMSIKDDMYYRDDDYFIDIETADKTFRLWTIEDAKDGDVLCYKNEISLYNYKIKNHKGVETTFCGFVYYCCYDGKEFVTDSLYSLTEANKCDIHPATKEQCDLLFSKMKEAGYEWDADKKVLVMMGIDNDDEQYEELLEDDKINIKQNPTWSEEDEETLTRIVFSFEEGIFPSKQECRKNIDFLNSLKNRVQPKQKQEWSEEDEEMLKWLCRIVHSQRVTNVITLKEESELGQWMDKWLNHNPQSHWKPTDEQMEDLKYAINMVDKCCEDSLQSLYNELKKNFEI